MIPVPKSHPRYGTAVTDGLFMTSRDGRMFKRWAEAFLRPGPRELVLPYSNSPLMPGAGKPHAGKYRE